MDRPPPRAYGPLTPIGHPAPGTAADDRAAWHAGREDLREALGPLVRALLSGLAAHELWRGESGEFLSVVREKPGRRRLAQGRLTSGEQCFFKHYPAPQGQPSQGFLKRKFGRTPAAREFAVLRRLHAAGLGVPEPLAFYRFPNQEQVLVTRRIEGESFGQACARTRTGRRPLIEAVGALVRRLHAAGYSHRDLHAENIWVGADGPLLIDLPAAIPWAARWLRRRDLGQLDTSLTPWLSLPDRVRLRAAALGAQRPFADATRLEICALGRSSERRRRARMLSRTARALRTGRLYTPLDSRVGRGMRLREADEERVRNALERGRGKDLWVQRFERPGFGMRDSPARRAWLAGHGLRARGIGAPLPLAFVERRRLGRVGRSSLVLEALPPAWPADFGGPAGWLRALIDLGAALRRDRVDHRELATASLCLGPNGQLALTGLAAIRFPRHLDAHACQRIDDFVIAQVDASGAAPDERAGALAGYTARTVFLPGPVFRIPR